MHSEYKSEKYPSEGHFCTRAFQASPIKSPSRSVMVLLRLWCVTCTDQSEAVLWCWEGGVRRTLFFFFSPSSADCDSDAHLTLALSRTAQTHKMWAVLNDTQESLNLTPLNEMWKSLKKRDVVLKSIL